MKKKHPSYIYKHFPHALAAAENQGIPPAENQDIQSDREEEEGDREEVIQPAANVGPYYPDNPDYEDAWNLAIPTDDFNYDIADQEPLPQGITGSQLCGKSFNGRNFFFIICPCLSNDKLYY